MIILWILPCCVHPPVALLRISIMSSRTRCILVLSFVMGSRKVHITFLTAHMGHCTPKCASKKRWFFGLSCRKCIHIMHLISISSWHHNEHIVPAFVRYHIPASHFAWVITSSCICVQHTFCSTNCIPFVFMFCLCMILAFSSAKWKQKKGVMKIHDAFLVACVRYHEPTMLGS